MNFRRNGPNGDPEPPLNLTSLIDVLFLLVIFFAVSTTFRVTPGLSVRLPAARSEKIAHERHTLKVVLTSKGKVFLDGKEVPRSELLDALRKRKRRARISLFILEADEEARHGWVVELMDAARKVGIQRLAIATRHETEEQGEE